MLDERAARVLANEVPIDVPCWDEEFDFLDLHEELQAVRALRCPVPSSLTAVLVLSGCRLRAIRWLRYAHPPALCDVCLFGRV